MGIDPMIVHIEYLPNNISDLVDFIKECEVKAMGVEWFEDLVKNKKNKTSGSMMIAALHSIQKRDDKEIFNKAAKVVADALQKKLHLKRKVESYKEYRDYIEKTEDLKTFVNDLLADAADCPKKSAAAKKKMRENDVLASLYKVESVETFKIKPEIKEENLFS